VCGSELPSISCHPAALNGENSLADSRMSVKTAPLVFPTFKASTQHGYKTVLNNHVLPAWRDRRLRDIERIGIQQWVGEKFRQGTGWQTVRNAWVLLSGILESAVEYGYLTTDPARGVKFPQKGLKEKPTIIAGETFTKLLDQISEPHRTMVRLIAATGLRIGELLALRWSVLDLGCLVPQCGGGTIDATTKETLWDRCCTGAPRPLTPSEQQYSDRRLRSRR
jgi:integrase